MPATASTDSQDLAAFGYKQELERSLGRFSSFAAGFSYISILTGVFQLFYVGFAAGGPAFFWAWPLVFIGQALVALCFAELAAHYPLSGSVYQWARHVGSGAVGWLTGWIYLACLIVTLAAVALALQGSLPLIHPCFQLVGDPAVAADCARNAVLLGCGLIAFTTTINVLGVGLLARINNAGVFAEIAGIVLLIGVLAASAVRGPEVVFDTMGKGGAGLGYMGPFLAAALMASYVMYGFDTAGTLAEETAEPRRTVPRAILQALGAAALAGGLVLLLALMAAPDVHAPELASASGGLPLLVKGLLGPTFGPAFLAVVVFAVVVCALAVHTGTVRLIFAMARDNNLPFGHALSAISARSHTPIVPAVLVGVLAAGVLAINVNFPQIVGLVASVAIVWANLAYLLVTASLLRLRLRGWPGAADAEGRAAFSLGAWGLPVNVVAMIWGVFMVVNVGWPRPEVYGTAWYQQYAAIWLTAALVAVGGLYYFAVQRHRTGVLAEHRAEPPGPDVPERALA